jgi:hypothetical protein
VYAIALHVRGILANINPRSVIVATEAASLLLAILAQQPDGIAIGRALLPAGIADRMTERITHGLRAFL